VRKLVPISATNTASAIEKPGFACANHNGRKRIAPDELVRATVTTTAPVLMEFANVISAGLVRCAKAKPVWMVVSSGLAVTGCVSAMKVLEGTPASTICALTTVRIMGNAIATRVFVLVILVGVQRIVLSVCVSLDVTTETAVMEPASATLDILVLLAMSRIAPTDAVTTASVNKRFASVTKDGVEMIAL